MDKNPKNRVKDLFADALEKHPDERAAFLDEQCGDDTELQASVQTLLDAFHNAQDFLEEPYGGAPSYPKDDRSDFARLPRFIADFKIVREIGKGGMGTVYEAEQLSLNRKVALKVLPSHLGIFDDVVLKFRREAEAGGRQSHPCIVSVYAVGEHEGINYIAQELVNDGVTLLNKVQESRQKEKQPAGYYRETAKIIEKVAWALEHAHKSGVIHRDIKPSNILITREGQPKVSDFGLAKVEDALALSRTGDFAGTPYYMSPEQVMSRKTSIDKRTDVYSLGVTLYEMLTLQPPFEGKTSLEVMKQICFVDPIDPYKINSRVPHDLSVICLKAMEKVPRNRYPTMKEFAEDLSRFLRGDVIRAKPAGLKTRFWKRVKRNPVVSASLGVALLSLVCFIGYELFWSIPQLKEERNKAKVERDKALAAEKRTEEQKQIIKENYDRIIRLSDLKVLSNLEKEAGKLWPAYPEKIGAMNDWLQRTEDVLLRLDEHRQILDSLRKKALPVEGDIESGIFLFSDTETGWWHDTLTELVIRLECLADKEDGLKSKIEIRLTFAETIEEKSIQDHRSAWDEAITSIKNRVACPLYDGLLIEPQLGFVPLGRDPDSGLWEFAHLQTGAPAQRGKDGKLILNDETGLVFVLVPGGSFQMGSIRPSADRPVGSPNVDPQAGPEENPVHEVSIYPLLLSKYEMTQGQWLRITGENPSAYSPITDDATLLHPVEQVDWYDCTKVLRHLKLRLPSEAEWEYAARAGTTTVYSTGDKKESLQGSVNLGDLYLKENAGHPWWPYEEWLNDGIATTAPVGSLLPNAFGLHDVHGSLWEWCQDRVSRYEMTPVDGSANEEGELAFRILRGGSWMSGVYSCRSAMRIGDSPNMHSNHRGLRPAANLQEEIR